MNLVCVCMYMYVILEVEFQKLRVEFESVLLHVDLVCVGSNLGGIVL